MSVYRPKGSKNSEVKTADEYRLHQAQALIDNFNLEQELEKLVCDDGVLYPKDVVNAAKDPASPLHQHFDWNDADAAEAYRVLQARTLIESFPKWISKQWEKKS